MFFFVLVLGPSCPFFAFFCASFFWAHNVRFFAFFSASLSFFWAHQVRFLRFLVFLFWAHRARFFAFFCVPVIGTSCPFFAFF